MGFKNTIEKINNYKFTIDINSKEFEKLVGELESLIQKRTEEIEKEIGQKEYISISTRASKGDLVLKFHRSKSFILLNLNQFQKVKIQDDRFDSEIVSIKRSAFLSSHDFYSSFHSQVSSELKIQGHEKICKGKFCRFFIKKRKTKLGPPQNFLKLTTQEKVYLQTMFNREVQSLSVENTWSSVEDSTGKPFLGSWYPGGLEQYLTLRRIPKERWSHYRLSSEGVIEVNLANENFFSSPWGDLKTMLVEKFSDEILLARRLWHTNSIEEAVMIMLSTVSTEFNINKLYLWNSFNRSLFFQHTIELLATLRGANDALVNELKVYEQRIEEKHRMALTEQLRALGTEINKLQIPIPQGVSVFEISHVKIPAIDFSLLPLPVQKYLELQFEANRVNQGKFLADREELQGTQSIFRAPFTSEMQQIKTDGSFDVEISVNFEPILGTQVREFSRRDGYSGQIIEFTNIPKYLLMTSESDDSWHPEVRLRFPTKLLSFRIR